jgi:hypothetical protein
MIHHGDEAFEKALQGLSKSLAMLNGSSVHYRNAQTLSPPASAMLTNEPCNEVITSRLGGEQSSNFYSSAERPILSFIGTSKQAFRFD